MTSKGTINKNLITNSLNQIIGVGFPILIQYYIIRHLRLDDIGYWAIINSAKSFVLLSISFLNIYLIKVLAEDSVNEKTSSYLTNTITVMYVIITIPFLGFLGYMFFSYRFLFQYVLISSIPLLTTPLGMDFYFQAKFKNDYLFYRRLVVRILFIVSLFVFVKNKSDFIYYVWISSLALTLEHMINFYMLRKFVIVKTIEKRRLLEIFKGSIGYLPFNLSYNSLPNIAIMTGAYFLEMKTLAVITILMKIINLATTFISSTVMVLFPLKVKNINTKVKESFNDLRYLRNTVLFSLAAIIGLVIFRKLIFIIFLHKYEIANLDTEFIVLSFYILIHSIYNYLVFNFYLIKNKSFFISKLNFFIILIFFIEIIFSKQFHFHILFALEVIIPPSILLVYLIKRIFLKTL